MKFSTWFDTSSPSDKKLSCSCGCGFTMENRELMAIAACIRIHFKATVTITSGPRCRSYNANMPTPGAKESRHIYGDALDIQVKGVAPSVVQQWVIDNFPLVSVGKGKTFTHIDVRPLPRKVFNY